MLVKKKGSREKDWEELKEKRKVTERGGGKKGRRGKGRRKKGGKNALTYERNGREKVAN